MTMSGFSAEICDAYHASVIVAAEELTGRAISRAHLQLVLAPSEES